MTTLEDTRLLIPDLGTPPIFTDDQINAFLVMSDDDVFLAAADALDTYVNDLLMSGAAATIKTDDLSINDKDGILGLQRRVQSLRDRSLAGLGDEFVIIYPYASQTWFNGNDPREYPWS